MSHIYQYTIKINDKGDYVDGIATCKNKVLTPIEFLKFKANAIKQVSENNDIDKNAGIMINFAYLGNDDIDDEKTMDGNKVNKNIPDFLIKMSEQMNEQDNRITADPIWQVRCKRAITCAEDREDFWILCDNDSEEYDEIYNSLEGNTKDFFEHMCRYNKEFVTNWELDNEEEFNEDNFDIESNYNELESISIERISMQYIEEVVKSCLTESDANWFIKRKQHDYPKLYTYVESMCYCPQMIELRNWIISLT